MLLFTAVVETQTAAGVSLLFKMALLLKVNPDVLSSALGVSFALPWETQAELPVRHANTHRKYCPFRV